MKVNITRGEALSLLQAAAMEPLGLLTYASDPHYFIQALYRAKREDPSLEGLQVRQTPEGIAICHPPDNLPPFEQYPPFRGGEHDQPQGEKGEYDDQKDC